MRYRDLIESTRDTDKVKSKDSNNLKNETVKNAINANLTI